MEVDRIGSGLARPVGWLPAGCMARPGGVRIGRGRARCGGGSKSRQYSTQMDHRSGFGEGTSMLFERETQLSDLRELFAECRGGKGRMAVVSGPVGTGKSELLEHSPRRRWTAARCSSLLRDAEPNAPFPSVCWVRSSVAHTCPRRRRCTSRGCSRRPRGARRSPGRPPRAVHGAAGPRRGFGRAAVDRCRRRARRRCPVAGVPVTVARRVRSGGVMIVLNEGLFAGVRHPLLRAGLRAPRCAAGSGSTRCPRTVSRRCWPNTSASTARVPWPHPATTRPVATRCWSARWRRTTWRPGRPTSW